ncbi:MAG TPA: hypothetical protein VK446_12005 [Methylocystis sp.]|nr:hypothetical protein [Methylocystis sp.]
MVEFIASQVFGKRAKRLIVGGGGYVSVKREGALLIANGESERVIRVKERAARLLLREGRKPPIGRQWPRGSAKSGAGARRDLTDMTVFECGQSFELGRKVRISLLPETGSEATIALGRISFHCVRDRQQVVHGSDGFIRKYHATGPSRLPEGLTGNRRRS